MTYATLAFGRVKYFLYNVGDARLEKFSSHDDAREFFSRTVDAPWKAYREATTARETEREKFIDRSKVRTWYQIQQATGGRGKPPRPRMPIDEVDVDGQTYQVPPSTANDFIRAEFDRRYPATKKPAGEAPNWPSWSTAADPKEVRTWAAYFIGPDGSSAIELPSDMSWDWGFPIQEALRQLNRLEQAGWKIVQVSEDHGLYTGADAANEAYLTRVRYLLHNPAPL